MAGKFQVKLWGVRGSLPTPMLPAQLAKQRKGLLKGFFASGFTRADQVDEYLEGIPDYFISGFGGNTTCVEAKRDDQSLIIDAGSGLRTKALELMGGPCGKGSGEVHILFTHLHWDHLIGLPFFIPIFIPGNTIHLYAVQEELEKAVRTLFQHPFFPVGYDEPGLGSNIVFHRLKPREMVTINGMEVTPYQLDHPDPCWGFRIVCGGKVYAHCVDTETKRYTEETIGPDIPLYRDVDLMVYDAQYALIESIEKVDWGHSSANLGLDMATHFKIKKVIFTHHDPFATDVKIGHAEEDTKNYYRWQEKSSEEAGKKFFEVDWCFAREGMTVDV